MPDKIPYYNPRDDKPERDAFYKGKRWRQLSKRYLKLNPLCGPCEALGLLTIAKICHHKIERRDAPWLEYDWGNLAGYCRSCHAKHHNSTR